MALKAKIITVVVAIKCGEEVVTAHYDATAGSWAMNGPVFARHLKALAAITALCREADQE